MSYDSTILADSPVSYWPLNETSGTTALDSADANNGTYNGGFTLNQGAPKASMSNSVLFNGSTGYIQVSDATNLHFSTITIEAWIKTTQSGEGRVVSKYASSSPFAGWVLEVNNGVVRAYSGVSFLAGTKIVNDNAWHYIVITITSGGIVSIYVDGILDVSQTVSINLSNTNVLRIGTGSDSSLPFSGYISSVAVYNSVLTPTQITNHYSVSGGPGTIRVSQEGLLAVTQGNPTVRVSQAGLLAVTQGNPKVRISQEGLLAVVTLVNIVKNSSITTQEVIEALYSSQGQSLISQEVIEALYSPGSLRSNITQEVIETLFKVSTGKLILASMDGLNRNANFSGGMN